MDAQKYDKAASKTLRSLAKKDIKPDVVRKLREDFNRSVLSAPERESQALLNSFDLIRDYWHASSRLTPSQYVQAISDTLSLGLPESAAILCTVCIDSLTRASFEDIAAILPTPACIDLWIKQSKAQKKLILKSLHSSPDKYYATACCDWFLKKAPVKQLQSFAERALQTAKRPNYLPSPSKVLAVILTRDRKFLLTKPLVMSAVLDAGQTRLLLIACSHLPNAAEPYARVFGQWLVSDEGSLRSMSLISTLEELLRDHDESLARFTAHFSAHVATTWSLSALSAAPNRALVEDALLRLGLKTLLTDQGGKPRDLWFASSTGTIAKSLATENGKISSHGAMEIALAMRATQTDEDASDALWSAAFNLGIREIGKPSDIGPFDPLVQEDIKGGLLRSDPARVVRCGWKMGELILLRAQVERA